MITSNSDFSDLIGITSADLASLKAKAELWDDLNTLIKCDANAAGKTTPLDALGFLTNELVAAKKDSALKGLGLKKLIDEIKSWELSFEYFKKELSQSEHARRLAVDILKQCADDILHSNNAGTLQILEASETCGSTCVGCAIQKALSKQPPFAGVFLSWEEIEKWQHDGYTCDRCSMDGKHIKDCRRCTLLSYRLNHNEKTNQTKEA